MSKMTYKIGSIEFDGTETIAEVIAKVKQKSDFEEFARRTFKKESSTAQELIDSCHS